MFAWLLLALLAFVSAQSICINATATDDLAGSLAADLTAVVREADTNIDTTVTLDITTSAEYRSSLLQKYDSQVAVSADAQTQINTAVGARLDAIGTAFGSLSLLVQQTTLVCLAAKKAVIVTYLTTVNATIDAALTIQYAAFNSFQANVTASFDAIVNVVASNDALQIAAAAIAVDVERAIRVSADLDFYVQIKNQQVIETYIDVANKVYAWLSAVAGGSSQATIDSARADANVALAASLQAQIDYRRALALKDKVEAYLATLKADLQQRYQDLQNAAQKAWADVRAEVIAFYNNVSADVTAARQRLADYLSGIHCDTTQATVSASFDSSSGASGSVTMTFTGFKCYDSRSSDQIKAIFCASLKAYFLTDAVAAQAQTYACVLTAKRGLEQNSETDVSANMVATDPSTQPPPAPSAGTPEPVPVGSSSSVVLSCFVLLLVSLLSHF